MAACGTWNELAAYKWVSKIKAVPDREEKRRQGVPRGARNGRLVPGQISGCQGKRHMCECMGEREVRQLESQAGAG